MIDLNGDGREDSLWFGGADGKSSYLAFQRADGSFGAAHIQNLREWGNNDWAYNAFMLGAGDVDGDGRLDLAWRHSDGRLWVSFGQANGTFTTPAGNGFGSLLPGNGSFMLRDINGDGRADGLFTHSNGSMTAVIFNPDRSNSVSVINSVMIGGTHTLGQATLADINGDGIADSIFNRPVNGTNNTLVALGQADGRFGTVTRTDSWLENFHMFYADVNGDGRADLVRVNHAGTNVAVHLGRTDGTWGGVALRANQQIV